MGNSQLLVIRGAKFRVQCIFILYTEQTKIEQTNKENRGESNGEKAAMTRDVWPVGYEAGLFFQPNTQQNRFITLKILCDDHFLGNCIAV